MKRRLWEGVANSGLHGVGAVLSLAGLEGLLAMGVGEPWALASAAIYGTSLVLLFTASTLYHAAKAVSAKLSLRLLDSSATSPRPGRTIPYMCSRAQRLADILGPLDP